jgi:hypothetical protein
MSNELAITAVTIALRNYLIDALKVPVAPASLNIQKEFRVSTLPLHKVREKFTVENVVNLLLYRVDVNAAWRNQVLPSKTAPGENGPPPLSLDLDYIVTAYGEEDREDVAHFILGQAMRFMHDYPFIQRHRLELALPEAKVHEQIERVKITPRTLSVEELSKLWTVFQTQYHLSAAYVATVVLIESRVPSHSALPVLTRGKDDRGIDAIAGAPPSLDSAHAVTKFGAARLGDEIVVEGQRLDLAGLAASVRHPLMAAPVLLPVTPVNASQLRVALPPPGGGVARNWPAGFYSIALILSTPDRPDYATNEVPFALAPAITVTPDVPAPHAGLIHVTITATPQIRIGQTALVIWDGTQITPLTVDPPPLNPDAPTEVKFKVAAPEGIHRVRLRVDGVDSIVMRLNAAGGYEFDPAQSIEVLP